MGYAYNADIYCDDCANEIMRELDADGFEDTGDTDEYPQSDCGNDESDCPQHCAGCSEFMENSLTSDGYDYVREAVRENIESGCDDSIAVTVWAPFYDIDIDNDCDDCGNQLAGGICENCMGEDV